MQSHGWLPALALAALFALVSTASNAQSVIGSATSVKPQADGSVAGTLSAGSSVHGGETVKTGSAGQASLRFKDSTNMSVGPSSSVRLDKFVHDPNKGTSSVAIEASKGAFRFVTGSQNKGGEIKVKTPYGTLGVRG
jgi:hypothetical protein